MFVRVYAASCVLTLFGFTRSKLYISFKSYLFNSRMAYEPDEVILK